MLALTEYSCDYSENSETVAVSEDRELLEKKYLELVPAELRKDYQLLSVEDHSELQETSENYACWVIEPIEFLK